ncbi:MAG: trimeric intracellular cation channel family protein [Gemmatimonadales bacterium]|nr:MAG: trimeric intracellular cation channel family protein [Gemmatimonadales bacterium]
MDVLPPDIGRFIDLAGVAVFAVSGALAALRVRMDLLGVVVVAAVTAIGGGTTRDVLLDRHPVFWIDEPTYLAVILAAAAGTLVWTRFARPPQNSLAIADALGLAFFVIAGAQITARMGYPAGIVILMGTITGVAGGAIRDVLSAQVPMILRRGELYATAAIAGAAGYLLLMGAGVEEHLAAMAGMALIVALRFGAILFGWKLPVLSIREEPPAV